MTAKNANSPFALIIANIFFLIAVYLYFIGWIYTYYFLDHFNISFNTIDIPFYYFFVYSYSVITNWLSITVFSISIIAIYISGVVYASKWIPIFIMLILFPIFFFLAGQTARSEAVKIRMGYANKITFFFKKDTINQYPSKFLEGNDKGKLKIIAQTKERFFVLYQPPSEGNGKEIPFGFVYDVPRADVLLALIEIH